MEAKEYLELYNKEEDLHPDLIPFVVEGPLGIMISHPIIYEMVYIPGRAAAINLRYEQKKRAISEAIEKKEFTQYLQLYERPWRIAAFASISHLLNDEDYWSMLGWLVTDTENAWQNKSILRKLLGSSRGSRFNIMSEEDREYLERLPDVIRVYRGCQSKNIKGWSWTLDIDRARWFATRYILKKEKGVLLVGTVRKENVIAYLSNRGESEILVNPRYVKILYYTAIERSHVKE